MAVFRLKHPALPPITSPVATECLDRLELGFDVDNDGVVAPLTDGLLVLRHFFGFTGTALTQGRA